MNDKKKKKLASIIAGSTLGATPGLMLFLGNEFEKDKLNAAKDPFKIESKIYKYQLPKGVDAAKELEKELLEIKKFRNLSLAGLGLGALGGGFAFHKLFNKNNK